ncbi:unnamed protein product [Cyprideis torosa]|uniref:Uncharacterized protein n=1 Tax=Cyprideis torosa TaxID=163714 RepID=A0A7R8WDB0_9CRUS|nr:unnamed protein product [Cyprideis torosa]CAG0889273.1 unnamed protein product [Cyprideis torosa]
MTDQIPIPDSSGGSPGPDSGGGVIPSSLGMPRGGSPQENRSNREPSSRRTPTEPSSTAMVGSLYAVVPLPTCPHLECVRSEPPGSGSVDASEPCAICGHPLENWLCLTCYKVFCSRYANRHMLSHYEDEAHPVCLSYADLSAWCYPCESYVHNEVLIPVKQAAHRSKFGNTGGYSVSSSQTRS